MMYTITRPIYGQVSSVDTSKSNFAEGTQPTSVSTSTEIPYISESFSVSYTWGGLHSDVHLAGDVAPLCKLATAGNVPSVENAAIEPGLSKMALRKRYPKEANAHRAMMARRRQGAVVHPTLISFASFLHHVGPMPASGCTLDRIDNNDREYAPKKVRWADKHTQNSNKGDTLTFYYSRTGDTYTTSRLAALQTVSTAAIRKRRAEGWTDDEIVEGSRSAAPAITQCACTKEVAPPPRNPRSLRSAREIQYLESRAECEAYRKEYGAEPFPANPYEIATIANEGRDTPLVHRAELDAMWSGYLGAMLPNWWRQFKPHIEFNRLAPEDQALIEYIDPNYVLARKFEKTLLSNLLPQL